jgi:hypothetical protein
MVTGPQLPRMVRRSVAEVLPVELAEPVANPAGAVVVGQ